MAEDNQADLFEPTEKVIDAPVEKPDPAPEAKPAKEMSVRESIDSAVQEVRARDEKGRFARAEEAPPESKAPAKVEPTSSEPAKPAAPKGAPASWTAEERAHWDSLPPAVQAAWHRREADTERGVKQLQSRYDAMDRALAPHRQVIQQSGRSEADVVSQLIGWTYALANPNKQYAQQALQHLARSFNIDIPTPGSASTAPQSGFPNQAIHPEISQRLNQLTSTVAQQQAYVAQQQAVAAEQHVMSWAKDRPHFQSVRETMARLINADLYALQSGQMPSGGFVKDGNIDLDAAYNAAVYANPETRAAAIQEEQAKKAAANKAAVDKARSAAVSVRTGTPSAPAGANDKQPKNQSVREAIRDAWAQHRSR